jgi:hypothetical protein
MFAISRQPLPKPQGGGWYGARLPQPRALFASLSLAAKGTALDAAATTLSNRRVINHVEKKRKVYSKLLSAVLASIEGEIASEAETPEAAPEISADLRCFSSSGFHTRTRVLLSQFPSCLSVIFASSISRRLVASSG